MWLFILVGCTGAICSSERIVDRLLWVTNDSITAFDRRLSKRCSNRGFFLHKICVCYPRYKGRFCQIEPCKNEGVLDETRGSCSCRKGTSGPNCTSIDHCYNNGTLTNSRCVCAGSFGGPLCDREFCKHGTPAPTSTECLCEQGYTGVYCDIEEPLCVHGSLSADGYCVCQWGFAQPNCSRCLPNFTLDQNQCRPKSVTTTTTFGRLDATTRVGEFHATQAEVQQSTEIQTTEIQTTEILQMEDNKWNIYLAVLVGIVVLLAVLLSVAGLGLYKGMKNRGQRRISQQLGDERNGQIPPEHIETPPFPQDEDS